MFVHNLFCQIYRQLFTLLSFLHAQCDTQTKGSSSIFLVHCIICAYRHLAVMQSWFIYNQLFLFLLLPLSHIHPYIDYRLYNYLMLHPIPSPKVPNGAVFSPSRLNPKISKRPTHPYSILTQRLSQLSPFELVCKCGLLYCSNLLFVTGVSNYKFQYHMLKKAIMSYNFDKVPIILLLCDILSSLTFVLRFFVCGSCSASKNNKHVNAKTFTIGKIFWEKCCIF